MTFDKIILGVMAIGILIGAIDRIIGNKFGLGEQFEEGFNAMGPLALGMVGIMVLAPVIAKILGPVIIPIFELVGADPAMFAALLANDMGGYHLAMELSQNHEAGLLAGLIVASMLGCTIVFSIPVGLGLIEVEDRPYFAKGLLAGLIMIPIGSVVGGIVAGMDIVLVLTNMVPVIVFSSLLAFGLKFVPDVMIKGSLLFGKFIVIVITIGLAAASFQEITGIVLIAGMAPISDALVVIGQIGMILLGTFPILHLLVKVLDKPLTKIGSKLGMNATGAAGLVITLANSIPVYKMMKDMTPRGKVINTAWLVCATAALGDHLGFTAGINSEMITPVVVGKMVGAVLSVGFAMLITKNEEVPVIEKQAIAK